MSDAEDGFFSGKARQLDDGRWRCANCPRKYATKPPARDCCFDAAFISTRYIICHGDDPDGSYLKIGEQGSTEAWIEAEDPVMLEGQI